MPVPKINDHCTTTAFHSTNMPTHCSQVPTRISTWSTDITRTYNLRCSIELTNVQINKFWNMQQVESMTSNPFLRSLHYCEARTKQVHTAHWSANDIGPCSVPLIHTIQHTPVTELTIVKINKSWNMQQVENMTNTPFPLSLHWCKARKKHALTLRSTARTHEYFRNKTHVPLT